MSRLTEKECKQFTGLTKSQFNSLESKLKSLKNSPQRTKSQALTTYLFWLKTGLPYRCISTLFSFNNFQAVGEYCGQTRKSLMSDFVPQNLGPNHIKRDEWLKHNTKITTELFNMNPKEFALITDGTYLYCQKSQDNTFQKKSWSVQKNANLVKPFVLCATDGYIVDVCGPYPSTDNDAKIMSNVLQTNKELRTLLKANDHIIMDRGFRDCVETLETKYKFRTHIPSCIPRKQKQLTTIQANQSRFVTKCRWTVEAINGLLKTLFRANDDVLDNKMLYHCIDDYKIGASLINKYHNRLLSDKDNASLIADNMKKRLYATNKLETIIDPINRKRKLFTKMNYNSLNDFPKLDMRSIRDNITLGSYQLKQSLTYLNRIDTIEMFKGDNKLLDPTTTLIRAQIKSRHSNSNIYHTYVSYKPNENSYKGIDGWICTCKSGKRTVGTCSHIASVIYKLSNQQTKTKSNKNLESIFPSLPVYESGSDTEIEEYSAVNDDIPFQSSNVDSSFIRTESIYPDLSAFSDNYATYKDTESSRIYQDLSCIPGTSGINTKKTKTECVITYDSDDSD